MGILKLDLNQAFDAQAALPPLSLKGAQQEAFAQLVAQHKGNKAELAEKLGISERSLYRKLKALR